MSGHSKWSQIKHKKAITDQKKSSAFGKLAKFIAVAARDNPDPRTNLRLKSAIEHARSYDMPNDNIDRILKKASDRSQAQLFELVLEAFGPGGVGIIITAITDNRNRTIGDIKTLLSKNNAQLAGQGSVVWMFKKEGLDYTPNIPIVIDQAAQQKLNTLFEALDNHDDVQEIFSNNESTS